MHASNNGYIYTFSIKETREIAESDNDLLQPATYIKQIKTALENGQHDACRDALLHICEDLRACPDRHDVAAIEIYFSVALVFLQDFSRRKHSSADIDKLFRPWRNGNWTSACLELEKFCDQLFDMQESEKQKNICHIIKTIEEYINHHINEDLSLTVLSDFIGYNATYLSRFYSEKTGNTISNYIARQKLRVIESMMREPELSLNQIASLSGFSSRTYFNNYIKRITGQSPQKYREGLLR